MNSRLIYRSVSPTEIEISERELRARLGADAAALGGLVDEAKAKLFAVARPAFSAMSVPVAYYPDGEVRLGGLKVPSRALLKNLAGADSAYLVALTLGVGVERELLRLEARSITEKFVFDAAASAMADSTLDFVIKTILGDCSHTPPFSPGYGDFSIELQGDILRSLSAERLLGISLTEEKLMIPTKSITAIIGIKENKM